MASGGLCRQTSLKKKIHQTICPCSSSTRAQGMSSVSLCRRVDCDDVSYAAGFSFMWEYFCLPTPRSNFACPRARQACLPCTVPWDAWTSVKRGASCRLRCRNDRQLPHRLHRCVGEVALSLNRAEQALARDVIEAGVREVTPVENWPSAVVRWPPRSARRTREAWKGAWQNAA